MNELKNKKPNFFIVGSPRCGTTSLAIYLSKHEEIFFSRPKEPNYFCTDYPESFRKTKTEEEYKNLFDSVNLDKHKAIGEGSVWYLSSQEAIPNILSFNPDAKFIVMVRNPIDIARSKFYLSRYFGDEDQENFKDAWRLQKSREKSKNLPLLCLQKELILYGKTTKLGKQLERLYHFTDKDKVHVVVFDDFVKNTKKSYKKVLDFLEVKQDNKNNFPKYNSCFTSRIYKVALINKFIEKYITKKMRPFFEWNYKKIKKEPLDKDFEEELKDYFKEDVQKLSSIINRDLTHWVS